MIELELRVDGSHCYRHTTMLATISLLKYNIYLRYFMQQSLCLPYQLLFIAGNIDVVGAKQFSSLNFASNISSSFRNDVSSAHFRQHRRYFKRDISIICFLYQYHWVKVSGYFADGDGKQQISFDCFPDHHDVKLPILSIISRTKFHER